MSAFEGSVETDADGKFMLPLSNPPVSRIQVTRQGYAEEQLVFDAQPAPPVLEIRLQFENAGVFGQVMDSENRPAKRFTLVFRSSASTGLPGFVRNIQSENGKFSVRDLPPGVYALSIRSDVTTDPPKDRAFNLPQVEIRRGFLYGQLEIHLQPLEIKK
jgi:hypothetical protein